MLLEDDGVFSRCRPQTLIHRDSSCCCCAAACIYRRLNEICALARVAEPPVSRHRNLHKVMNIVQSASGLLQIIISLARARTKTSRYFSYLACLFPAEQSGCTHSLSLSLFEAPAALWILCARDNLRTRRPYFRRIRRMCGARALFAFCIFIICWINFRSRVNLDEKSAHCRGIWI